MWARRRRDELVSLHKLLIETLLHLNETHSVLPVANVSEWDGPAVLPPRTAQRMTGGLEARGAHRHVP